MRSNLRAESDIQMDILLRENETPGEGEGPLTDNNHTFLYKKGKVGKMKPRKRRPQGNSQREGGRQGKTGKGKEGTQPRYQRGKERETRGTTYSTLRYVLFYRKLKVFFFSAIFRRGGSFGS